MDTADITIPADALARASERAAELRISPADFVAAALAHYLAYQDSLYLARDMDRMLTQFDHRGDRVVESAA